MLPQYADDLRFQIERSPFSEEITAFLKPDALAADNGGAGDIQFDCAFSNGGAEDIVFDYSLVSDGAGTGVTVRGIFDESVERDEGSKALRRKPRVTVFGWPREARAGTSVLVRGKQYAVTSYEADANLGIVVWLR